MSKSKRQASRISLLPSGPTQNEDFGIFRSTVDLWIRGATNLRKTDKMSESDPYLKVEVIGLHCRCNEKKLRTESKNNNHSPIWNR